MSQETPVELSMTDLRVVTAYAVACAHGVLDLFEQAKPDDDRPRIAIETAQSFADGARRSKALRDGAWSAMRAAKEARESGHAAASEAANAAMAAAGAAFLHPLAKATQVKHILGSAAHAAHAHELATGDPDAAVDHLKRVRALATPAVVSVLRRYPAAPRGGGRVGELVRRLDVSLRGNA
jgi:hypothetical protein